MNVTPSSSGNFTVTISGHAEVPASYGVVVTTNPNTPGAQAKATIFKESQVAHDETVSGVIDLGNQTKPTTYEIVGVVTPQGYAGAIAISPNCEFMAAFSPHSPLATSTA